MPFIFDLLIFLEFCYLLCIDLSIREVTFDKGNSVAKN